MKLIKSLSEVSIPQKDFPLFFWDQWLESETGPNSSCFLCYDDEYKSIVPFKLHKLKFLKKANYIYTPLNYKGERLATDLEKRFVEKFHDFLKSKRICDVIFPPLHVCTFTSIPKGVHYFSLGIIKLDLEKEESTLFKSMSSNYQNEIRKAIKSDVSTHFNKETLPEFYSLYKKVHSKQNLSYLGISYFQDLLDRFPNNTHIGISKLDLSIENGIFNLHDNKDAYYLYAGSKNKPTYSGSNKLLLFDAIKDYKRKGIKSFIMGGYRNIDLTDKKHLGIQKFKLRFGAEVHEGYHFIKVISPVKYHLFSLALRIKTAITGTEYSFINKSGLEIKKAK